MPCGRALSRHYSKRGRKFQSPGAPAGPHGGKLNLKAGPYNAKQNTEKKETTGQLVPQSGEQNQPVENEGPVENESEDAGDKREEVKEEEES